MLELDDRRAPGDGRGRLVGGGVEIRLPLHSDHSDLGGHGRHVDCERRIVDAVGKTPMLGVAAHARIVLPGHAAFKRRR